MKKNLFTFGLVAANCLVFGQNNNSIEFTKLLTYQQQSAAEMDIKFTVMTDKTNQNNFIGLTPNYFSNAVLNKGRLILVDTPPLMNSLEVSENFNFYSSSIVESFNQLFISPKTLESLDSKQTFNGKSCQEYMATIEGEASDFLGQSVYFCIDASSPYKNVKSLFPNVDKDGLLVAFGMNSSENPLVLSSEKTISQKVDFDFEKNLEKFNTILAENKIKEDSINNIEWSYEDLDSAAYEPNYVYYTPICSYYQDDLESKTQPFLVRYATEICGMMTDSNYDGVEDYDKETIDKYVQSRIKSYPKDLKKAKLISSKEVKELKAEMKRLWDESKDYKTTLTDASDYDAAYAAVDSAAAYAYEEVSPYESSYKQQSLKDMSLAIDYVDSSMLKATPDYCTNVREGVPTFDNPQVKDLLLNYAGQVCDLYISEYSGNVYMKGTIDALRRSMLELHKTYPNLNNKDKQKLSDYLDRLD